MAYKAYETVGSGKAQSENIGVQNFIEHIHSNVHTCEKVWLGTVFLGESWYVLELIVDLLVSHACGSTRRHHEVQQSQVPAIFDKIKQTTDHQHH